METYLFSSQSKQCDSDQVEATLNLTQAKTTLLYILDPLKIHYIHVDKSMQINDPSRPSCTAFGPHN